MESAGVVEERLGIFNRRAAQGRVVAGLGDDVKELSGRLTVGLFPGLVVGDDVSPKYSASLASPSMTNVVNVELVLSLVLSVPLGYERFSPVGPVFDGLWGSLAGYRFASGVSGNAVGGPALVAAGAGDQALLVGKAVDAELFIPGEGVALDGLSTPALAEFIHVVLAVLVETDWFLRPLFSGQLALLAPLVDLVGLRAELVVDLARVVAC